MFNYNIDMAQGFDCKVTLSVQSPLGGMNYYLIILSFLPSGTKTATQHAMP